MKKLKNVRNLIRMEKVFFSLLIILFITSFFIFGMDARLVQYPLSHVYNRTFNIVRGLVGGVTVVIVVYSVSRFFHQIFKNKQA